MNVVPQKVEGAGKAGCSASTRSLARNKKAHERSRHRFAETIRPSLRNGLRLIPRSPRRPGFLATVACGSLPADLTPASGRQDHTALPSALSFARLAKAKASTASRPTFVTMANAPLIEAGRAKDGADLGSSAMPGACDRLTRRAIFA